MKALGDEVAGARVGEAAANAAATSAAGAADGVVVARRDGLGARRPAPARRRDPRRARPGGVVALARRQRRQGGHRGRGGQGPGRSGRVGGRARLAPAAKALGGGTAKNADLVQGGGQNVGAIDDALELLTASRADAAVG